MGQKDKKNRYDFAKANFASLIARALLDKKMPGNAVAELKATGFEAASKALEKLRTTPDDQVAQSAVFDGFAALIDPTRHRKGGNCKFLHWACKKWLEAPERVEDIYKLKDNLAYFEKLSRKLHEDGLRNQIDQINGFADLAEVLEPYQRERARRKAEKQTRRMSPEDKARLDAETSVIYDGPEGKVVMPHTMWASQFWGNQTKWCIAAAKDNENMFKTYNQRHPVMIYLPKPGAKDFTLCGDTYDSFKFAAVGNDIYDERDFYKPETMPPCMHKLAKAAQDKWAATPQEQYLNEHGHAQEILELPEGAPNATNLVAPQQDERPPIEQYPEKWRDILYILRNIGENFGKDTVPSELLEDRDFILAAVEQNAQVLAHAEKFKNDKEVVMSLVSRVGVKLFYASEALRDDRDIVMAAVQQYGEALQYASDRLRKDPDVVLAAMQKYKWSVQYADEALFQDKDFVIAAVQEHPGIFRKLSPAFQNDKDVVMAAVQQDGMLLRYASEALQDDKDVVIAAVQQTGWSLEFASYRLNKDTDVTMAAVRRSGAVLYAIPLGRRYENNLVVTAAHSQESVIEALPPQTRKTLEKIKVDPEILRSAAAEPEAGQDDMARTILEEGCGLSSNLVPDELLKDPAYIRHALQMANEDGAAANILPQLRHTERYWGDFAAVTSIDGALATLDKVEPQAARPAVTKPRALSSP